MTMLPNLSAALPVKRHLSALHREDVGTYCRMFIQGKSVPKAAVAPHVEVLAASNLCAVERDELVPRFLVTKIFEQFIATDRPEWKGADRVLYLADQDSLLLARNIPRLDGRSALDIGTGSGVQAIVAAAQGADVVTAVDISERALAFARFNATVNGYEHKIEFVHGSFETFSPERRYDLIVSNLPFVPVPDGAAFVLSGAGGRDGLSLARRLIDRLLVLGGPASSLMVVTQSPGDAYVSEIERLLIDRLRGRPLCVEAIDVFGGPAPIEIQFQPFEGLPGVDEWRAWTRNRGFTHQHYLLVRVSPARFFEHRRSFLFPRLELHSLNMGSADWKSHYEEISLARRSAEAAAS